MRRQSTSARSGSTSGSEAARTPAPESPLLRLQRLAGNAAVAQLVQEQQAGAAVRSVVSRPGQPLDVAVRRRMEPVVGADLSAVRVHTDAAAAQSAAAVQASAYTSGNAVVFGAGAYQPGTPAGDHVLAHELTHVVQQRRGPVAGSATAGGLWLSDPHDRDERAAEHGARSSLTDRP